MASPHPSGPLHLQANPKKGNGGFTLLELIFTLTILAVAGLAGTNVYRDAIIANQLHRATSTLVHDLALGRLEAVRRATRITLCPG
ncbi:MAG TPA: prepilin-type N-terminal cleavage/methylation domain-containing protein, partial [Arenicellales bacterium]|nr:prepilin-type N-terminal cleavage/methylation domain-containing protein [Arenicellales bacterium]